MQSKLLFGLIVISILGFYGCASSGETIVITEAPTTPVLSNTNAGNNTDEEVDDFLQVNIGENNPINSLDPLFAYSTSELRATSLIYEGLTRINEDNVIEGAIASSWGISEDSTIYIFNLRTDIYYQDSDIFGSGFGRKVVPQDIEFAFNRMTNIEVPSHTARRFINVLGLEPMFLEKHLVLNPAERVLTRINGIEIVNDSTISFSLTAPDPLFLYKLAQPSAAIYPRESLQDGQFINRPVGSGPFSYIRNENEGHIILAKNKDYRNPVDVSRVDIFSGLSQSELYRSFARQDIDMIPELAPSLSATVLDDDNNLLPSFTDMYSVAPSTAELVYNIYFNEKSQYSKSALMRIASEPGVFESDNRYTFGFAPDNDTNFEFNTFPVLYTTFTEDPFVLSAYGRLAAALNNYDSDIQLTDIKVPFPQVALYASDFPHENAVPIISFSTKVFALHHNYLQGFKLNNETWWINLDEVTSSKE